MKNKIVFLGAGSTIFAKNILGDCMLLEALEDFEYALYDIDTTRLEESYQILSNINNNHKGKAKIINYTNSKEALRDAKFVVNAIQVGGYKPGTVRDFEIPRKYGLKQTIADTIGIGGIMRALRTLEVLIEYTDIMEEVCPDALLLNYTNPMSILTGYIQKHTNINAVGLCHSVQVCVPHLFKWLGLDQKYDVENLNWEIAGINHMAWLLAIKDEDGTDLYPQVYAEIEKIFSDLSSYDEDYPDLVRMEMARKFGYYITESSEHSAEYYSYFIKDKYPELIDKYKIPIDEYLTRCVNQIEGWNELRDKMLNDGDLTHNPTSEYGAYIMNAIHTNTPYVFWGNVINDGMITNLPYDANVEVKCVADIQGIKKTYVGKLPDQLASLNLKHIAVHQMVEKAFATKEKKYVYRAALLDPHTSSELSIDQIYAMVDELLAAHSDCLSEYK